MLVYEKSGPKGQIEWHRGYEFVSRIRFKSISDPWDFLYLKDLPTAAPYRCMAAKMHALYKISHHGTFAPHLQQLLDRMTGSERPGMQLRIISIKSRRENKIMKNRSKQSSQQHSPQHFSQAALQTTASTTTAAETTAAETTTAEQQLQDPQTQRIPLSQTVPTRSASTSSLFTALSTTARKVSSKVSPRTDSWKAKILPY